MTDEALGLVAARFKALGDPARLKLLSILMEGEQGVGALVESSGLEQPVVSRHLAVLRREGLVVRRADGNRGYYRISDMSIAQICELVCGGVADRLAGHLDALPGPNYWAGMGI